MELVSYYVNEGLATAAMERLTSIQAFGAGFINAMTTIQVRVDDVFCNISKNQ